jgi:hypothetical protein
MRATFFPVVRVPGTANTSDHVLSIGSRKYRSVAGTESTTGSASRSSVPVEYSVSTFSRTTLNKSSTSSR